MQYTVHTVHLQCIPYSIPNTAGGIDGSCEHTPTNTVLFNDNMVADLYCSCGWGGHQKFLIAKTVVLSKKRTRASSSSFQSGKTVRLVRKKKSRYVQSVEGVKATFSHRVFTSASLQCEIPDRDVSPSDSLSHL